VSIRLRVAAVFTLALAIAFALGSWLLVSQVRAVVLNSVDAGLAAQLGQASRLLPPSGSASGSSGQLAPGDYLIQVIDPSGRVVAAGPDAADVSLLTPALQRAARRGRVVVTTTIDGEAERVMAGPLPARRDWTAAAAVSLESANATTSALVTRLVVGGSIFVVVAGAGAYLLARAALAPVDRLRRQAAAVSARDPSARLAVPKTRDEIAALARTMNELLGRLHTALARQRSFVSDASHELRTPFAVLQGELELASRPGRSRDELAEAVASAREEADRLARITDDLLLLARSDESQLTARAAPADLAALLGRSADLARHRAASGGVILQVRCPPRLTANVDADLIRQAIDNLVDNALRFAPAGSGVDLVAAASGADVTITVADTGAGFPAEFLPHAFERFRRPDDGRSRAAGGAGLGLAIVAAIARAHGGTAVARNRPAGGAEVTLQLPRAWLP
jgi:two-component system OmpR family sensor kinase